MRERSIYVWGGGGVRATLIPQRLTAEAAPVGRCPVEPVSSSSFLQLREASPSSAALSAVTVLRPSSTRPRSPGGSAQFTTGSLEKMLTFVYTVPGVGVGSTGCGRRPERSEGRAGGRGLNAAMVAPVVGHGEKGAERSPTLANAWGDNWSPKGPGAPQQQQQQQPAVDLRRLNTGQIPLVGGGGERVEGVRRGRGASTENSYKY